jgi:hypothetical protein
VSIKSLTILIIFGLLFQVNAQVKYRNDTIIGYVGSAIKPDSVILKYIGGYNYSVLPSLPNGLSLSYLTGIISGIPLDSSSLKTYTISSPRPTFIFIKINLPNPIDSLKYSKSSIIGTAGKPIVSDTPSSKGGAISSYSISPLLPTGLIFSTVGVISGTPLAQMSKTTYKVIATNLANSDTAILSITVNPSALDSIRLTKNTNSNTICTGESVVYTAVIIDSMGIPRTDLNNLLTWSLLRFSMPSANSPACSLSKYFGSSSTFYAGQAYRNYSITVQFVDPNDPTNILTKSETITVKPSADYFLVVELNTTIDTFSSHRLSSVTMDAYTSKVTTHAIVRDKFSQFTRMANVPKWTSKDTTVATVSSSNYIGIISRATIQVSATSIFVSESVLSDSVIVVLRSGKIDSIRLVNYSTGKEITKDSMGVDSSLLVKIQVIWSTDLTKTWVDGSGNWSLSPDTIKWNEVFPKVGSTWRISPKTPGVENLTISSGTVSKVILIIITKDKPTDSIPVLTLKGKNPDTVKVAVGGVYVDSGCRASEPGGDLTAGVKVSELFGKPLPISTNSIGTYVLVYTVTGKTGKIGTATRYVYVIHNSTDIPPKINHLRKVEKFSINVCKNQVVFNLIGNSIIKIKNIKGELVDSFNGNKNAIWNCKATGFYIASIYSSDKLVISAPIILNH